MRRCVLLIIGGGGIIGKTRDRRGWISAQLWSQTMPTAPTVAPVASDLVICHGRIDSQLSLSSFLSNVSLGGSSSKNVNHLSLCFCASLEYALHLLYLTLHSEHCT